MSAIVESSDDAIIGYRLDGIIESWNRGAERLFGYSALEILDRHISILVPNDQLNDFADRLQALRNGQVVEQPRTTRKHKDGSSIPVSLKISPTFDDLGTIVGASAIVRDITKLKKVEEELRQAGERFQLAVRATRDIVCDWDICNDRVWFSERFFEVFGYDPATFPTGFNGWADLVHPEDRKVIPFDGATYSTSEYRLRRADGTWAYVHARMYLVRDDAGTPLRKIGVIMDISEIKQAENDLRATASRLKAILDQAPVGIVTGSWQNRFEETNAAFQRMTGYSGEELRQMDWKALTHPDDIALNTGLLDKLMWGELTNYDFEKRYVFKGGKTVWVRVVSTRLDDEHKISIVEDITERKKAEEALRESERFLRAVIDVVPHIIFVKDREGRYLLANRALAEACGTTPEQMVGRCSIDCLYDRREAELFMKDDREVIESGRPKFRVDEPFHDITGRQRIHQAVKMPFVASGTGEPAVIGVAVDTTESRLAQQALAESEERLRTIVELAPDGIFVISEPGQVLEVNEAACKQLGYTRGQLLELKISDFISPRFAQRVAARLRGEVPSGSYESAHIRADGVEVPIELSVAEILFRGQPAFLGITRDISDRRRAEEQRKKLEEQLRQSQKMEAVGKLAGGIAHDFNNLLMVIQSYTEMVQDSFSTDNPLRQYTEEITKAADRAANLTRQMLAFSRKQILSPVVLNLNAVVADTAKMLKRLIREDIELKVSQEESLWAIEADTDQLVQVLMNLSVNARDAMPRGGTLTIATGNVTVEEDSIGGQPYVVSGDYVRLSVTDTGIGISRDVQGHIFDPFFTTKEVGKGTGLGLATVYGIVKQSGGYVWVDSERGKGTRFTIYLPRVKQAITPDMPAKPEAWPRGAETVLVAEDEEALRGAVCGYLRSLGYTVLATGSGKEALSIASQHEGQIDLLITDVVMPGLSGRELAQMLRSLRPNLKTIYMSGYADDVVLRQGIHELGAVFLQKPFSLGTIARKVRDTLGRTETVQ